MEQLKHTALTNYHIELGAKMQPFAGFYMPVEYSGVKDEHKAVRKGVGVFDVSHMGEFWVKGPKAFDLLQKVTTNDVSALYDGKVQYTCMPNGKGGIVDDLLIYRFNEETYMLVVNGANIEKDWKWIAQHAFEMGMEEGKELYDASGEISLIAVQGPLAMKTVNKLTEEPVEEMKFYTFKKMKVAGIEDAIFSVTGYTGSGGCEIYVENKDAPALWEAVFEAGREFGIKPAGLAARDTLRLEKGLCLYGNDIDETTSPIEARLGWITKFTDNNDFIDRDLLYKQKTGGVERRLVGFVMEEKGIPRKDYDIVNENGEKIGRVTSGTMSPMMNVGIGMGYVKTGYSTADTEIFIVIRNRSLKARVVKMPIYKE